MSERSFPAAPLTVGSCHAALTSTGAFARFDVGGLSMIQYPASELEAGPSGLWLRILDAEGAATPVPLTGPLSGAALRVGQADATLSGASRGLSWSARLAPAASEPVWFWHVSVRNEGEGPVTLDAVSALDVALAPYAGVRINEYYVAQYLDLTPLDLPGHGRGLAVRQNMPGERQPWLLLGCTGVASGWATDSLQLLGRRDGLPALAGLRRAALPDARLQHEHTLAVLATEPVELAPGASWTTGFFGLLVPDHPDASGPADAALAEAALALPEANPTPPSSPADAGQRGSAPSLFATAGALEVDALSPADLEPFTGAGVRLAEDGDGGWWAYVTDAGEAFTSRHKEERVLRPHGHILRTGAALTPTTDALTSTVYMAGLFASQVTQGNVAKKKLLSGRRTYLGLQRAHGLRAFADFGDGWALLDVPSAWGLLPDRARWFYATGGTLLAVTATARDDDTLGVAFETLRGEPPQLLIAAHLALGGDDGAAPDGPDVTVLEHTATVRDGALSAELSWAGEAWASDDAPLFADGVSRGLGWLTLQAPGDLELTISADLVPPPEAVTASATRPPAGVPALTATGPLASEVEALSATLPWFAQNALIHYLSPRGLEQYTGGGWGTRDVSQGPVGLLTALDATDALRDVMLQILTGQNERGDWPQAFDFLPPKGYWEQLSSHGDVIGWPLQAVGDYLLATGDADLLGIEVPFVAEGGAPAPAASVLDHLTRAVTLIEQRTVPGGVLPAYGHGDWNDSLQPADPRLAERMASTWTAVLFVQALDALAGGLEAVGSGESADAAAALAARCRRRSAAIAAELREHLLADGLLAGYGVFDHDSGAPSRLLVHPRDEVTGLTYGVLPWIHAITAEILTPAEASDHLAALREHLLGPDGARLFDRPTAYRGGPLRVFKRAEAATFWGREIGLMYTHAHLRYAEALARFGDAPGLLDALLLVCPFGITERIVSARPRQSTCYYSSSDGAFADRYDAAERYDALMAGEVPLEGGWRVYSSGPGLFLRLVVQCLLGVRRRGERLEIDPVLDPRLDGLVAHVPLDGRLVEFRFHVQAASGVSQVRTPSGRVAMRPLANPYRPAGVEVTLHDLLAGAPAGPIEVTLGSS